MIVSLPSRPKPNQQPKKKEDKRFIRKQAQLN